MENPYSDRIYGIYQVFSQFPDETEKAGLEKQNMLPVYPVDPV